MRGVCRTEREEGVVVVGGQNVSVRCVQDGEGGRSCGGWGRSECECEVCAGRRGRKELWLWEVRM